MAQLADTLLPSGKASPVTSHSWVRGQCMLSTRLSRRAGWVRDDTDQSSLVSSSLRWLCGQHVMPGELNVAEVTVTLYWKVTCPDTSGVQVTLKLLPKGQPSAAAEPLIARRQATRSLILPRYSVLFSVCTVIGLHYLRSPSHRAQSAHTYVLPLKKEQVSATETRKR